MEEDDNNEREIFREDIFPIQDFIFRKSKSVLLAGGVTYNIAADVAILGLINL